MIKLYFFRLNSPEVWYTIQPEKAYRYSAQNVAQRDCDLLNSVRDITTIPEGQTLKHICRNFRIEQLGPEDFIVSFEARTMAEAMRQPTDPHKQQS
jgi:hypothetical protein